MIAEIKDLNQLKINLNNKKPFRSSMKIGVNQLFTVKIRTRKAMHSSKK